MVASVEEQAEVVWSIGQPGGGPLQFGSGGVPGDPSRLEVCAGAGGCEESWPAYQPGPLDAASGWAGQERTVAFAVGEVAAGYRLEMAFHASHGACPDIAVECNGRRGVFRPSVDRRTREEVFRQSPIAGEAHLTVRLPGEWLVAGDNRITVGTSGAEPPEEERDGYRSFYGSWFGSGISWDHLRLVRDDTPPDTGVRPAARSLPLFVRGDGGMDQVVEVSVAVPPGSDWPAEVRLDAAGWSRTVPVEAGADFGEWHGRVLVPELAADTPARLAAGDAAAEVTLAHRRKWTLHLVNHVHLDIGFTDYQAKVLALHSRNLDQVLGILEDHPDYRFTLDGGVILGRYLEGRSDDRATAATEALRQGRLSVNPFHSIPLTGLAGTEDLLRSVYLSSRLAERHGFPLDAAHLTDVPSYTWAMPSVLAGLGIDTFFGIANHHRGGNADSDLAHLRSPVRWRGPDGSEVVAFFSDSYSQLRFMAGDPLTVAGMEQGLVRFVDRYDRPDYLPADLPVIGIHADNEGVEDGHVTAVERWNSVYAYPRLVWSTPAAYGRAVAPLRDRLPVWEGDGGSYWEDGCGTAAALIGEHRRTQTLLGVTEAVSALTAVADPSRRPAQAALDRAWEGQLFGIEHTWSWAHAQSHPEGDQGVDQTAWKRHCVADAARVATDELRAAMADLASTLGVGAPAVLVVNTLPWQRSCQVTVEVDDDVEIRDGTGPVPEERRPLGRGLSRRRLAVADVPAWGTRVLGMRRAPQRRPESSGTVEAPAVLSTSRWEARVAAGGRLVGLTHRATGAEMIDRSAPWALGEVLHVAGGGPEPTTLSDRKPNAPRPDLDIRRCALDRFACRKVFDGWIMSGSGTGRGMAGVEVDIHLHDDDDVVEVEVSLDKLPVRDKESVYVAFPFAPAGARVVYDRQQGWVDPAVDHSPGAANEWFTTQYAVGVIGDGPAVTWTAVEAPLFSIGDVVRGTWATEACWDRPMIMSWVMNNYWSTNVMPIQPGPARFRYAFRVDAEWDPARAARFGREVRTPAAAVEVTELDRGGQALPTSPSAERRLVDLACDDHVVAGVFPARREDGLLVRLVETAGVDGTARLRNPFGGGARVLACRGDERPTAPVPTGADGTAALPVPAFGVASYLVLPPSR